MAVVQTRMNCIFLILSFSGPCCIARSVQNNRIPKEDIFDKPQVFITISGLADYEPDRTDRQVELNWNNIDINNGSVIALYDTDPVQLQGRQLIDESLASVVATNSSHGYYKTELRYIQTNISAADDKCAPGFWIGHVKGASIPEEAILELSNCLKIEPKWMQDSAKEIGDIPLNELMIPGTHNAGAGERYMGSTSENPIKLYTLNQEENLYEQLVHGIRYFDLRVSFYENTEEKFWINHDVFRIRPLVQVLNEIQKFINETEEIVLVDFHRFPVGFSNDAAGIERHNDLIKFVRSYFDPFLASKTLSDSVTPNILWSLNKRIIWSYAEGAVERNYDFLWPYLKHAWGNKNNKNDLEDYLQGATESYGCKGFLWSAMAELTPSANDIITRPYFGLRGYADLVNIPLTYWYQRPSWYSKTNIVSTDFYLGNNIVEMAISANRENVVCLK